MTEPTYLYRHPSSYIFRLRVPHDIRGFIGKSELRYSLQTGSFGEAKSRSRLFAGLIQRIFRQLRQQGHPLRDLAPGEIHDRIKQFILIERDQEKVVMAPCQVSTNRHEKEHSISVPSHNGVNRSVVDAPPDFTLSEVIGKFLEAGSSENKWSPRTKVKITASLALLQRIIGDRPIKSISRLVYGCSGQRACPTSS